MFSIINNKQKFLSKELRDYINYSNKKYVDNYILRNKNKKILNKVLCKYIL